MESENALQNPSISSLHVSFRMRKKPNTNLLLDFTNGLFQGRPSQEKSDKTPSF